MIAQSLKKAAGANPERVAIVCDTSRHTYRELWAYSGRAAQGLLDQGIVPGDRIGSWSPNVVESIVMQCAALRVGAVMVHLDPECSAEHAAAILERERVRSIFVRAFHLGRQYPAMIKSVRAHLTHLAHMVTHGRAPRFERTVPGGWQCFLEQSNGDAATALEQREACVASASASELISFAEPSGMSTPVRLGEQEILRAAGHAQDIGGPICVDAPFHRPVGLILGCLANLLRGATVVLPAVDADAATIINGVRGNGCEGLVISRATAAAIGKYAEAHGREFIDVARCLVDGSGELPPGLARAFGAAAEVVDHDWLAGGRSIARVDHAGVAHGILPSFGN